MDVKLTPRITALRGKLSSLKLTLADISTLYFAPLYNFPRSSPS